MDFKKMILVLSITITIIMIGLFGVSFAWYSFTNSSTSFSTTTGTENVSVLFAQSEYLNVTAGVPILAADVDEKASKNRFTLSTNNSLLGSNVATEIKLTNILLDSALAISDFKLQLLENNVVIANLTGENIGNNTEITLKNMTAITVGRVYNYEIRVWVNDTGVSQNSLMGKNFKARITVNSNIRK